MNCNNCDFTDPNERATFFTLIVYDDGEALRIHTCFNGPKNLSEICGETLSHLESLLKVTETDTVIRRGQLPDVFKPAN